MHADEIPEVTTSDVERTGRGLEHAPEEEILIDRAVILEGWNIGSDRNQGF
jgi:hypothetical protein